MILKLVNTHQGKTKKLVTECVWKSDSNLHRFQRFYFAVFSLVLVSIAINTIDLTVKTQR